MASMRGLLNLTTHLGLFQAADGEPTSCASQKESDHTPGPSVFALLTEHVGLLLN